MRTWRLTSQSASHRGWAGTSSALAVHVSLTGVGSASDMVGNLDFRFLGGLELG